TKWCPPSRDVREPPRQRVIFKRGKKQTKDLVTASILKCVVGVRILWDFYLVSNRSALKDL
ncbi:hypothetical protein X975_24358, partial [Stegodyphus mimosarum]